jgi:hypothetical protein
MALTAKEIAEMDMALGGDVIAAMDADLQAPNPIFNFAQQAYDANPQAAQQQRVGRELREQYPIATSAGQGARYILSGLASMGDLPAAGMNALGIREGALPSQQVKQYIDQQTYGALTPRTARERYQEQIGEFVGGAGGMNALFSGSKMMQPLVTKTLPQAGGVVGAAVGSQFAEEQGGGALSQMGGGLIGGLTGAGLASGAQAAFRQSPKTASTTGAERFVAKNITPEEAQLSLDRIQQLQAKNVDSSLAVATPSEPIFRIAETRAQTLQGAREAQRTIETVIKDVTKLENSFISNLASNSKSVVDDANVFKTSATSIKNAIIDARRAKATPLYQAIEGKAVPPSLVKNLVTKNPVVAREFENVATDPVMQQFLQGAEPNTVGFLDKVKQAIDSKMSVALRQGDNSAVAAYKQAKTNLTSAIEDYVPAYRNARFAFEQDSVILDKFLGGKKGAIKQIVELADEDATKAFTKIFSLQPEQIARTRRTFELLGQPEAFKALTRGYLSQRLAKVASEGDDVLLSKVLRTPLQRAQIEAALGDKQQIKLFNEVLRASNVARRSKDLGMRAGSPTLGRAAAKEQIDRASLSGYGKAVTGITEARQKVQALGSFSNKEVQELLQNEQFYIELDKILFNPEIGKKFLNNYLKNPNMRGQTVAEIFDQAGKATMKEKLTPAVTQTIMQGQ